MSYNILVVDDSKIVRAVVKKTLGIAGVEIGEIYEAGNGEEALEKMENNWIDIIFADINMPVMNGIEMVEHMANKGILAATPVVIVSTERSETRIADLKAKGIKGYLNKPFTPENIKEIVENLLGEGGEK